MAVTLEDINKFHRFAVERIEHANHGELTIDDLVIEWDSCSNRDEINIAIAEGIADVNVILAWLSERSPQGAVA